MKVCSKCSVEKPLSDFYAHPQTVDGVFGKCKECTRSETEARRDLQRAALPHRIKARKATVERPPAQRIERVPTSASKSAQRSLIWRAAMAHVHGRMQAEIAAHIRAESQRAGREEEAKRNPRRQWWEVKP